MDTEPLICPECSGRIGHKRGSCRTCNRFTQSVSRRVCSLLRSTHAEESEQIRKTAEEAVYADLTAKQG